MKKLHHVLAVAAMLLLVLALLLTSFQLAIYGDPDYRFYEREYAKYNVTESLDMEMEDVMDVTDGLPHREEAGALCHHGCGRTDPGFL